MKHFLDKIIHQTKLAVKQAENQTPLSRLRLAAEERTDYRGFIQCLSKPGPSGINIIAEIKRASPSKGDIRADLDPAEYARAYEAGGAAAISVLTEPLFFKGSLNDLRQARCVSSLPILRKDFIISEYQIVEAAAAGADAILLIVRILSPRRLNQLMAMARELGIDALVEVYDAEEVDVASDAGAVLVGINNRNLETFDTDISRSLQVVSRLRPDQVPVAASGIHSPQDIRCNQQTGIFNFLIGESLVRAEDTAGFLRSLVC